MNYRLFLAYKEKLQSFDEMVIRKLDHVLVLLNVFAYQIVQTDIFGSLHSQINISISFTFFSSFLNFSL